MARKKLHRLIAIKLFQIARQFAGFCWRNSIRILIIALFAGFLMKIDFSFEFNINSKGNYFRQTEILDGFSIVPPFSRIFEKEKAASALPPTGTETESPKNVSTLESSSASKIKKQQNYVARFAEVARSEMRKYGIPASITLAQGIHESNAGDSPLSTENNNHFGIKCFSKSCSKGHCSNFTDDSHKDFFRKYETAWESYRAHSIMLGGDRYKHLKKLGTSDYKNWAIGLQKAGYATDKRYAKKLIRIIEDLDLHQYDR